MSIKKNKQSTSMEVPGNQMHEFSSTAKINQPSGIIGEYTEKDELYDPFDHRDKRQASSDFGALAHLVKSSLGSGILAMPNAVKNGGLVFGGIGTIILGIICAHCVHMLVKSSHVLCRRTKTPKLTFAETAEAAFQCGPPTIRPFANAMKKFVNIALCATYVGGVCVYVVFISESIKQVVDFHTGSDVNLRLYIVTLIPAVVILAQIRYLKHLVPFSMLANVFMMTGLGMSLYFIFIDIQPPSSVEYIKEVQYLPVFFATVIFAIEGIGTVLPVENSMEKPQHFIGCPSVLNITMTIVISLYAVMGVFGYLRYGEATESIITLNLDITDPIAQAVKILIALSILFTYALQLYVPLEIICNALRPKFSHNYIAVGETLVRLFMALFTVMVALAVPTLGPFISLVGAIFFSILGIFIPAIIETASCWEAHLGKFKWRLWKNLLLVAFSMFALITGTWVSVDDIIKVYT